MLDKINNILLRLKIYLGIAAKQEKEELKEYISDMWKYSFGELPFKLYWIPLVFLFIICAIGLGGVLSLWALAHPIALAIYLVYVMFYLIYVLHERFTGGLD